MTLRQINMYFWTVFFWGVSFALIKYLIPTFGWVGVVTFRAFCASAILVVIAKVMRRELNFGKGNAKHFLVLGITSVALNLGGMTFALHRIGTSLTAILVTTIPLYSLIIEKIWSRSKPSPAMVVGLLIGFSGVVVLIGFTPQQINGAFLLGILGSVVASSGFAFGGNYARVHTEHIGPYEQTIGTFFFGGLVTLPAILFVPMSGIPTISEFGVLLLLAGSASSLAYILYFSLVSEIGPTKALSTEFLVPVVAVIVGALFLNEHVTGAQIMGASLIFLGCALVLGWEPQKSLRAR